MNGRNKTSNRLPSKNSIRYYLILLNELIPFKRAGLLLHSFLFILVQKCFTLSCHHFRVHYQLFLSCASTAFYKGLFCCCFFQTQVYLLQYFVAIFSLFSDSLIIWDNSFCGYRLSILNTMYFILRFCWDCQLVRTFYCHPFQLFQRWRRQIMHIK